MMLAKTTLTAIAATLALSAAADARSLEEAKASGTLIVGIQADNCPWGCLGSTGEAQGFDAAIARAFAAHLGLEVEFVPMAVANRIPALTTDKVDVLIASLGITAERAESVQFSQPYAENTLFVTAPKSEALPDLASLSGKAVGVPRSTPMDTILTAEAPADTGIQRFDDDASNIQALLSGQVVAVGSNQFYIQRLEAARPGEYENKFPIGALYQGIASRLGESDWNAAANEFLESFTASEDFKAAYAEWLQVPVPQLPDSIDGVSFTVAQQ
ncbi:transporter substrate-binding domain-containing protein [Paracoccus sediminis]|uniref:Amino acid ABC transporter substrate-binding protein, PAAT family n=1 Tax=Paracoccus sediminis TaxID=1214787 RepID=A0A238WDX8_9RHOB|nr:transporter substrate-binding domain-containing protein [Paracoccus sediminis]TBN50918.1 transporter substrate-binding domain-containing protein [Paracoccus sediminis]SNR44474.1 amino acid ABC transporter substrate-binding protein, PAAT family [Paracoccus sediminis]